LIEAATDINSAALWYLLPTWPAYCTACCAVLTLPVDEKPPVKRKGLLFHQNVLPGALSSVVIPAQTFVKQKRFLYETVRSFFVVLFLYRCKNLNCEVFDNWQLNFCHSFFAVV